MGVFNPLHMGDKRLCHDLTLFLLLTMPLMVRRLDRSRTMWLGCGEAMHLYMALHMDGGIYEIV